MHEGDDEMSSSDSTDSEEALQFSDQEFDEDREQLAAEVTQLLCKLQSPSSSSSSIFPSVRSV